VIVVDASAILELLLNRPAAVAISERLLHPAETLHAPQLLDVEVLQVLRRFNIGRELSDERGTEAVRNFRAMPIERYPHELLLDHIWSLRRNVTAYDAAYVALAQLLDCPLLTADRRLARAIRTIGVAVEVRC
jgi:predicted nucleic acid-binding protein